MTTIDSANDPHAVLLYDGTCGFCSESVRFILRHERSRQLRFAALDSAFGRSLIARHPALARIDSMVWFTSATSGRPERVLVRGAAALAVARYLGGPWRFAAAARFVPTRLLDAAYDYVARHRHDLGAADAACVVPSPENRQRFLP